MQKEQQIGYGTAEFVKTVAENKLGIVVPENTINAWVCLSRTIRIADDIIDNEPSETARKNIFEQAVSYLSGNKEELLIGNDILVQEMGFLKTHIGSISVEQKTSFIRNLKNLLRITEILKGADNPTDLARITMLEGQITARLFTNFLPEEFSKLDGYGEYLRFFTRLVRSVNAYDSIVDFPTDYKQGKIMVKPTLINVVVFTTNTLTNAMFVATNTSPSLLKSFGNGAITIAKDRKGNSSIHFHSPR